MTRRKTDQGGTPGGYTRPAWPWPEICRLTAHPSGQWSKKHKGKVYYFGPWSEPEEALRRWRIEWPRIVEGKPRHAREDAPRPGRSLTVKAACREHLADKLAAHERGELAWHTYADVRGVCRLIRRTLGDERDVSTIDRSDGADLLAATAHMSPMRRHNVVGRIRSIINSLGKLAGVSIDLGESFRGPPAKMIRRQRLDRQGRMFTPEQIRTMYHATADQPQMRLIVLLGINGGFDPSSLSELRTADVNLETGWIENIRPKNYAQRRVPLWPESVDALRKLHDPSRERVLVSSRGTPLIHEHKHLICPWVSDFLKGLGIPGTHRWFRYTFSTVAAEIRDDHARAIINGHVINGVPENYVLEFPADALRRVSDHVRQWTGLNQDADRQG